MQNKANERYKQAEGDSLTQTVKQERIKVAVRVRPQITRELGKELVVFPSKNSKSIKVSDLAHTIESAYDVIYDNEARQHQVYGFVQNCVNNVLQGFNQTIFAYGQTGSGKTFTMFGEGFDDPMFSGGPGRMF
eukprot:CAMPEP_0170541622 /NCGR_PEP_ID=MMETSP0211-20121228/1312_1 /TAXON_ID=311385 /ORGANISM="Pseudokeronopsis sp., Strain OXSARD2" /LENGTH=132 /DNA_ID=CAMNT_0010844431 /DNA_START=271 /DNA_END=669 /DNA_ORIENTATION=-